MEEGCSICLEDFDENSDPVMSPCFETKHRFHERCLEGLMTSNCPMCRAPLELSEELTDMIADNKLQAVSEDNRNIIFDIADEGPNARDLDKDLQEDMAKHYLRKLRIKKGETPSLLKINVSEEADVFSKIIFSVLDARRDGLLKGKNPSVSVELVRSQRRT